MLTNANILVCTDFSPFSDLALKAAEELRRKAKATLHVLHVNDLPVQWDWSVNEALSEHLNEQFEVDLLNNSRKRVLNQMNVNGVQGVPHVVLGLSYQEIHNFIRERGINLVIVGHKGRGNTKFHLGGLTNKLVASSPVPVLVIKDKFLKTRVAGLVDPNGPSREIISATEELSKLLECPSEIISLFGDILDRFIGVGKLGFSTKLLSLTEEDKDELRRNMKEKVQKELSPNSKTEVKAEVTTERKYAYHLNSILAQDHTSLAIMKRHQEGMLEKILIGSETRRMIEIFEGNLLILPP